MDEDKKFFIEGMLEEHEKFVRSFGKEGTRADFSYCELGFFKFTKRCLHGANFNHANLIGAKFRGADLDEADFSHANLSGADMRETTLRKTIFHGANLTRVDFSRAIIGADFRGACAHDCSWPLFCDNLHMNPKIDVALAKQLLRNALRVDCDDPAFNAIRETKAVHDFIGETKKQK